MKAFDWNIIHRFAHRINRTENSYKFTEENLTFFVPFFSHYEMDIDSMLTDICSGDIKRYVSNKYMIITILQYFSAPPPVNDCVNI